MSNGSILLLDDDRELVDSFARWFERKGYEATRSYHPKQSLITAAEHNYDVAVIDTGVADMNGLVLLGELVELKMFPVIVLSGEANPDFQAKALKMGACEYLVKPATMEELKAAIDRALELHPKAIATLTQRENLESKTI